MESRDARTLTQEAQEELRRQAIKRLKAGETQTEVARTLDVARGTVNRWWKAYTEAGSILVLRKKQRGRPAGSSRKLTQEQEEEVQKVITDKTPDQLRMKFALWTREAVGRLIQERFGVVYSLQSLSVVLKRWGFTPQRPLKRAYEQRPEQVDRWMKETYPAINERSKKEDAEIWWGDETAVKPEAHVRRSFAPKGKTPVVRQPARRFHSSLISAINNQGKMQWMALSDALSHESFVRFLEQLIKNKKRKVFLIVDNLRVHHSKEVKAWLETRKDRIELFYLPSYSPELNPDEYLNNDLKQNMNRDSIPINKTQLDGKVVNTMKTLSKARSKIRSFFRHPRVAYAA